ALELEKQRSSNQKVPGFLSLNGGGSLAGQGYLSARYAPFDGTPNTAGIASPTNSDGEGGLTMKNKILYTPHPPQQRLPPRYGTKVNEMADFYASARSMMYDATVSNAFRFSADDQTKYGNSGFGNACITARNVLAAGVGTRYIQIALGGWDNHQNIYTA